MNLFLEVRCFCESPCWVMVIVCSQPKCRRVAAMALRAPILGSWARLLFLNSLPDISIWLCFWVMSIGVLPAGGRRICALNNLLY